MEKTRDREIGNIRERNTEQGRIKEDRKIGKGEIKRRHERERFCEYLTLFNPPNKRKRRKEIEGDGEMEDES